ncbi:MAG: hypothetical protein ACKOX3_11220 [Bacteroidota bacterium]
MKDKDMSTSNMMETKKHFSPLHRCVAGALTLSTALLIAACGGGGSNSAPVPVVANSVSDLVGRWENPAANWDAKWLAPVSGQTASPIWLLSRDGSSMSYLEGTIAADGAVSASGKRYALNVAGEGSAAPVSQTWNATATMLNGLTKLSFSDGITLTRSAAQSLVVQSDVTGAWTSQLGNGLVTLNYSIDAQGVLKGTSTTGCNYVGYVVVRANSFVYDARLSETCIDGVEKLLNGIGSLATDKARLTLTLLGPSGAYAKALYLSKN